MYALIRKNEHFSIFKISMGGGYGLNVHFHLTISAKFFAQWSHRQCNFICCACSELSFS